MSFYKKRDRIHIIADVLDACRCPQTQTFVRRKTSISYSTLQSCLTQLVLHRWVEVVDVGDGQRKLAITDRGVDFLEKWVKLQKLMGKEDKRKPLVRVPLTRTVMARSA